MGTQNSKDGITGYQSGDDGQMSLKIHDKNGCMIPVYIRYAGRGKDVVVYGSWNDWQAPHQLIKSDAMVKTGVEEYGVFITLPPGRYEYKFKVDGEWRTESSAEVIQNSVGSTNNVIVIRKTDADFSSALDHDGGSRSSLTLDNLHFRNEIPSRRQLESWSTENMKEGRSKGPPILPSHLSDVILNKNMVESCDPCLLPKPNHALLKHLYALSIRSGVLVLSCSYRYKDKFVTTIFYKPVAQINEQQQQQQQAKS
ncbi:hypothetical protein SNEBB_002058 [Seison nebaliae]|nr:hypothetical protein SNEBB_002058 [Seison nebaliae]